MSTLSARGTLNLRKVSEFGLMVPTGEMYEREGLFRLEFLLWIKAFGRLEMSELAMNCEWGVSRALN